MSDQFQSGYIALSGRSNVGKSTLINQLVQHEVSITSKRPQTTQKKILGILTSDQYQAIFIDTPGIFQSHNLLEDRIQQNALSILSDVDIYLFITTPNQLSGANFEEDKKIIEEIRQYKKPIFLIINKSDLFDPPHIFKTIETYNKVYFFDQTFVVSALRNQGLKKLNQNIISTLPIGVQYYENDSITDLSFDESLCQILRQQCFFYCDAEIPYQILLQVIEKTEKENKLNILVLLTVQKESQKKIIIGKNGINIKKIIKFSKIRVEYLLKKKIHLRIQFKIVKNWTKNPQYIDLIGL